MVVATHFVVVVVVSMLRWPAAMAGSAGCQLLQNIDSHWDSYLLKNLVRRPKRQSVAAGCLLNLVLSHHHSFRMHDFRFLA